MDHKQVTKAISADDKSCKVSVTDGAMLDKAILFNISESYFWSLW